MGASRSADHFQPPNYAVIFTSRPTDADAEGYSLMAARMEELARERPGFRGIESARGADGAGITVSYRRSHDDIADWKRQMEHLSAQQTGRSLWYASNREGIACVETDYVSHGPKHVARWALTHGHH